MEQPHWNIFEWDDPEKKNGNVQHLRDHDIEPHEAEECSVIFSSIIAMSAASIMFMYWTEEPIAAED